VSCIGERRGLYVCLVGNLGSNRQLGRPRRRWKNNIKLDLGVLECGSMDWIELAQDRDSWLAEVIAVMNTGVP
jgi:hypothetical protein